MKYNDSLINFPSTSAMFKKSKTYKPFVYPWAVTLTQEMERMHWIEEEVDLGDDIADWKGNRMTAAEKNFITQILRMFTQSDVNVGEFYNDFFIPNFMNNELRNMFVSIVAREGIHQRAYALLNDTLGLPDSEYQAFLEYEEMSEKNDFMKDVDPSTLDGMALTMVQTVINEGVSLFASFAMLLSFQRRGLMKGMGKVVEWSTKDESKHVEAVCLTFRHFVTEHPEVVTDELKKSIYDLFRRAVSLEDNFIDLAFEMGDLEGLNKEDVKQYIRLIADRRLVQLGLKPNWEIDKNPLDWIDYILNGADHTNFFENKVADYEVGAIDGPLTYDLVEVILYSREGCGYCEKAKELLNEEGIIFKEIDMSDDVLRNYFFETNGFSAEEKTNTMPKIYDATTGNKVLVGGYTELENILRPKKDPIVLIDAGLIVEAHELPSINSSEDLEAFATWKVFVKSKDGDRGNVEIGKIAAFSSEIMSFNQFKERYPGDLHQSLADHAAVIIQAE